MGLLDWLKKLLAAGRVKRDVSRLAAMGEDEIDVLEEVVDLSGAPLKDGHRRRALRDRRLLPKRKPTLTVPFARPRRKRIIETDEANRLFAATMRTRDRSIRDLLPDEEQLERYGLPVWRSERELAEALDISVGELRFFSIHREMEKTPHYAVFSIPKRSGGKRLIMAPKRRLKALQRKLLELLVVKLPVSSHAHGFRRNRSIRTGAEPHVGRRVLLHLDIRDFFPSVHFGRVRGLLVALGYGYPVATTLAVLMTEAERQPVAIDGTLYHVPIGSRYCVQGAPTSPGLCNAVLLRADRRLFGLARAFGFAYTRYADDITFSGDDIAAVNGLRAAATRILADEGFRLNPAKTRIMRSGRRQTVTGVVVNRDLGLSRRERRHLRAMGHRLQQQMEQGSVDGELLAHYRGKLAYLAMLNQEQARALPFYPKTSTNEPQPPAEDKAID